MSDILYRKATNLDIPGLAKIRSDDLETKEYWHKRISGYMSGTHNPQQALDPRIVYVACDNESIVGFVAGHLTKRYYCEGELEWINVIEGYQRRGIASELVRTLAKWFIEQKAYKICVDPGNEIARHFYKRNGAENLNTHWMFWRDIRDIFK